MDDDWASLADELPSLNLGTAHGVARLIEVIEALGALRDIRAVRTLLPVVVARLWPVRLLHRARESGRNARLAEAAHLAAHEIIKTVGASERMTLDGRVRRTSFWAVSDWDRPWFHVTPQEVPAVAAGPHPVTILGLLSGHNNGHVRQAAVGELARHGAEALPWLLPRTVDWVLPVRVAASRAVRALLRDEHAGDFLDLLPLVLRVKGFSRVDQSALVDAITRLLAEQSDAFLRGGLAHADRTTQRATLDLLRDAGRVDAAHLRLALSDTDVSLRLRAARLVTAEDSREMSALRRVLFRDGSGKLRALGLGLLATAKGEKPDEVVSFIRAGIDDPTRCVREEARHRLVTTGHAEHARDVAPYYRGVIREGNAPVGAILGLGEVGVSRDWELLVPVLDGAPAQGRAVVKTLRALDRRETRELRLMMVDDPRPGVSREAAMSLRGGQVWTTDEAVIREYLGSPTAHIRRNAVRLASQLPGYTPPTLLLGVTDRSLEGRVNERIEGWLRKAWRMGPPPSPAEATELRLAIEGSALVSGENKADLRRLLDFIAPVAG